MSRIEDIRRHFQGQRMEFIKMGYKREAFERGIDEHGRAANMDYSVDKPDMDLILQGFACYLCGLKFVLGGLPTALPTCPLCGGDQTQRHAVATPDGW